MFEYRIIITAARATLQARDNSAKIGHRAWKNIDYRWRVGPGYRSEDELVAAHGLRCDETPYIYR